MSTVYPDLKGSTYPIHYDSRVSVDDPDITGRLENPNFKINVDFGNRPTQGSSSIPYGGINYTINRDDTYIKADDVNALQDAIMAVQRTIGCTKTGLDLSKTIAQRFIDLYNFTRMSGAKAKGLPDSGTEYNNADCRYIWGTNDEGTVTGLHSIKQHVHDDTIANKINLNASAHVTGTLDKARLNFSTPTSTSSFIHAGLLMYDGTGAKTLHNEIDEKLDKNQLSPVQTVKGPISFTSNIKMNIMQEEEAINFTKGNSLQVESNDARAWSGQSIKIPSNKNSVIVADYTLHSTYNVRYGRYNSVSRIRFSGLNSTSFTTYKDQTLFKINAYKNANGTKYILGTENVTLSKLIGFDYNSTLAVEYNSICIDFVNEYIAGQAQKGIVIEFTEVANALPFNTYIDSVTVFPMGLSVYDE